MFAHKSKDIKHPLVVWPTDLLYLDEFLRGEFSTVTYKASLEDGTDLQPSTVKDILDYENPDFARILSVTIDAKQRNTSSVDESRIVLGSPRLPSDLSGNVSYSLGDVTRLQTLERQILGRIAQMRPWYHWLYSVDFATLIFGGFLILWFGASTYALYRRLIGRPMPRSTNSMDAGESEAFTIWLTGAALLLGAVLNRVRNFFLPRTAFCIGRQEQWYKKRQRQAKFLFGTVILGILLEILGNKLSN
jgi:hypothetical protein